jgi:5S rRNA maturation endonuclease (ribonuclease M5)
VVVVPNWGHSSVTFINDNIQRLKQKQKEGKQIHIPYFGDLDRSGEEMDKVYKRKLEEYGIYNVDFQRKAVTKEQWERFDLLNDPSTTSMSSCNHIDVYSAISYELDQLLTIFSKWFSCLTKSF